MKHTELLMRTNDITHLSASSNYTFVHFINAPDVLFSRPVSFYQPHYPSFIRPHKCCLVNPQYIRQVRFDEQGVMELLVKHCWLTVSRRNKKQIIQLLQDYSQPTLIAGLPHPRTYDSTGRAT